MGEVIVPNGFHLGSLCLELAEARLGPDVLQKVERMYVPDVAPNIHGYYPRTDKTYHPFRSMFHELRGADIKDEVSLWGAGNGYFVDYIGVRYETMAVGCVVRAEKFIISNGDRRVIMSLSLGTTYFAFRDLENTAAAKGLTDAGWIPRSQCGNFEYEWNHALTPKHVAAIKTFVDDRMPVGR